MIVATCAWESRNCDVQHGVVMYVVKTPEGTSEELLCRFHGQYWPRVDEDEVAARRRTQPARIRFNASRQQNRDWSRRRGNRESRQVKGKRVDAHDHVG